MAIKHFRFYFVTTRNSCHNHVSNFFLMPPTLKTNIKKYSSNKVAKKKEKWKSLKINILHFYALWYLQYMCNHTVFMIHFARKQISDFSFVAILFYLPIRKTCTMIHSSRKSIQWDVIKITSFLHHFYKCIRTYSLLMQ